MSPPENLALTAVFLDAIKRDNAPLFVLLLSTNPELLEAVEGLWGDNPLLLAYKHGSLRVAEEIARRKPPLISQKDEQGRGFTVMHLACSEGGDVFFIKLMAELYPRVCLVEDNLSRTPLHISIIEGYEEAIRVLIDACPESLQRVTFQQETALHLAVKNSQCNAFELLVEQIEKRNMEYLLSRKDHDGNTVLHLATSNKLTRIVQLLLPDSTTTTSRVVVRVDSMNNNGHTALDVYYQISCNRSEEARQIGHILRGAGAVEGSLISPQMPAATSQPATVSCPLPKRKLKWTLKTKNVLLVVLVMIVATAFTVICNLPHGLFEENVGNSTFYFKGVISGQLPTIYYVMLCNTAGFLLSMGVIAVLIWSLPFGAILFFVLATTFVAYILILGKILPGLFVRIGPCNISGSHFVWLSAATLVLSGVAVTALARCLFSRLGRTRGITTCWC